MSGATQNEKTTRVTLDEVRHVADLANLELTPEELPRMAHDLDAMLGLIAQLNELDTAEIEPMAQVGETLGKRVVFRVGEPETSVPNRVSAPSKSRAPAQPARLHAESTQKPLRRSAKLRL